MSEDVKRVVVTVVSIEQEHKFPIDIGPGTKVADVLSKLGLEEYVLSSNRLLTLAEKEDIYSLAEDGEYFRASPSML